MDFDDLELYPSEFMPIQLPQPSLVESGYLKLVRALFASVINCLEAGKMHQGKGPLRRYIEARTWVATDIEYGSRTVFSFADVCDYLHIDRDACRAFLLAQYPEIPAPPSIMKPRWRRPWLRRVV